MKVLLVYPEMPPTMWNMDFLAKIRQRKAIYPPLGLLTVAALLPEDWNLQLVDLNIRKLKAHDLKDELLPALMKWRAEKQPSISFATQVSLNLVDDAEMMQLILEAGFRHIFVGIETPVEESLIECGKTQNLKRDLMMSVNQLHAAGFIISGGFILGFDTDPVTIFQKQIDFIQKSGIVIVTVNLLKAPFGTDLLERMKKENRLLEILDFDENIMNLIPKMDIEELYEKYRFVLSEIYSPDRIYERSKVFLQTFKNSKVKTSIIGKVKLQDFITLFLVIFYIGICQPSRLYFWKLLFYTQKKQPSHLRLAFLFGVLMYHYRRLYTKFCRFVESQ